MSVRAPPLGELLDALRTEGFPIGIDDHVRVGRLIALEVSWDEAELRAALRALLAKDPLQSATFDQVWTRLFAIPHVPRPPEVPRSATADRRRTLWWAGAALALVAIVATMFAISHPHGDAPRPVPGGDLGGSGGGSVAALPQHPALPRGAELHLDAGHEPAPARALPAGSNTARLREPADTIVTPSARTTLEARPSGPSASERIRIAAPAARPSEPMAATAGARVVLLALGLAGCVLALLGLALRSRRRSRFVPGPWRYALRIPPRRRGVLTREAIEDAAAYLASGAADEAIRELDVDRTCVATARAGGALDAVYARPRSAPSYVVLEDASDGTGSWRALYDELWRGLRREGVSISRYVHHGDLATCTSLDGREQRRLQELVEHCDTLIVVGDAAIAHDPVRNCPADWLVALRAAPRRLWIDPAPPARRGEGARLVARDTPVAHGLSAALAELSSFERPAVPPRAYPAVIEMAPTSALGFASLLELLGPVGARLLAALAHAGEPRIEIAHWLAEVTRLEPGESDWMHLAALPWLRRGKWPDGLREQLIAWLRTHDPALARRLADELSRALAASEPPAHTAAHLQWQLDVAGVRGDDATARRIVASTPQLVALRREVDWGRRDRAPARATRVLVRLAVIGGLLATAGGLPLLASPRALELPPLRLPVVIRGVETGLRRVVVDRVRTDRVAPDSLEIHAFVNALDLTTGKRVDLEPSSWRMVAGDRETAVSAVHSLRTPAAVVVVVRPGLVDRSMLDDQLERLRDALGPRSTLGVIFYCSNAMRVQWLRGAELDRTTISDESCFAPYPYDPSGEALVQAVDRGLTALEQRAGPDRMALIVLSDGTRLEPDRLAALGDRADAAGIRIDSLADSPDDDRERLLSLAELSNRSQGVFRWIRAGMEPTVFFDELASELAHQTELIARVNASDLPQAIVVRDDAFGVSSLPAPVPAPACGPDGCAPPPAPPHAAIVDATRAVALALAAILLIDLLRLLVWRPRRGP